MRIRSLLFLVALLFTGQAFAEDVWVNGYTRRDGTQVEGHYRSRPNAYNWDNKNYTPNQPAYNSSYGDLNRSSNWNTPSDTRFKDNNPYNDYPTNNRRRSRK